MRRGLAKPPPMHAPASLTGARRRLLQVPAQLRRRPGLPGGRPAAIAAACIAGLLLLLGLILVYTPIAHPKTLVVSGVTGSSEARITRLLEEAGVATIAGTSFGAWGEGYVRFSYANSVENIREALERMGQLLAQRVTA